MSYKPKSLFRIIEDIERRDLLLPHIQRPFVWEEDQMVRLFDSLMRNYPVQTLLFWRTKEAIRARQFMPVVDRDADLSTLYVDEKSVFGVEKTFVLDGQQRLQTLYALFRGAILDAQDEPVEAYLDLTQGVTEIEGTDLLYELRFARDALPLPYFRLRNLSEGDAQRDAATIAYDFSDLLDAELPVDPDARRARTRQIHTNISQLRTLLREEQHFWVQELDGVANKYEYRKVLNIFVRVNSGGTKLTASDLMFAALKEGWQDIEENTEQTVDMLNMDDRLKFEASFPLKCLLVIHGEGAETDQGKFIGERGELLLNRMMAEWPRAETAFQELRDFIEHDLRLFSDKVVRTYNAFVPLLDFLYHNPKPNEGSRARMRAYYHKANLFNWFASSGDATINALHHIVGTESPGGFPLDEIVDLFNRRGYPVAISEHHLSDNRLRAILLSIVYIDRLGTSPFNVRFKGNAPHVDHIYPQSMLRTRLGQVSAQINDIGNLRYVGATDNIRKRAELPAEYFSRMKRASVDIGRHLLLEEYAADPGLLVFDEPTFVTFRDRRRAEIHRVLRRVVDLVSEDEVPSGVRSLSAPAHSTHSPA